MEQQELFTDLPEDPFTLVAETRKDIDKRIKAFNKFEKRQSEQNHQIRLAHNLTFDFGQTEEQPQQQQQPQQEARHTMTRRDQLERKLAKREQWAQGARNQAAAEHKKVDDIFSVIPMGQPILVDHYSARGHINAIKKADKAMERGYEATKRAEEHESKAEGLARQLETTIFSDDENAIEKLEAKIKNLEQLQEEMKTANRIMRNVRTSDEQKAAELKKLGLSDDSIKSLLEPPMFSYQQRGFPAYALTNNNANIRRLKERIEDIKRRQERQQAAADTPNGVKLETFKGQWSETEYCRVTFAEKPDYSIIKDLKANGFYWQAGCWHGEVEKLPESVKELI